MIKKCSYCGSNKGKKWKVDLNNLGFFKFMLEGKADKFGNVDLCTECRHRFNVTDRDVSYSYCYENKRGRMVNNDGFN